MQKLMAFLGFVVTQSAHAREVVVRMAEQLSAEHLAEMIVLLQNKLASVPAAVAVVADVVEVIDPQLTPAVEAAEAVIDAAALAAAAKLQAG